MTTRANRILEWAVAVAIIAVVAALLRPVMSSSEPRRSRQCRRQLESLGLALRNYHATYGSYPPAHLSDAEGRPMHSWRVLLLPFLDQKPLYDEYHFDEPWDGPRNRLLHERATRALGTGCYSCPWDWQDSTPANSYLAVVGRGTAWPPEHGLSESEIRDGLANTILLVEVASAGIHCLEPRDLNFDEMCFGINDPSQCGIRSSHHAYGSWTSEIKSRFAHVLLVDGTVRELPETTPPRVVRALLTVNGNEPE